MRRCRSCRERLPPEDERKGARCPACAAALFDDEPRRRRRDDVGPCAAHPGNAGGDVCPRCGNNVCDVCYTKWRDRWLCAACVDRALEADEAVPGEGAAQVRQALLALGLGALSWMIVVGALVLAAAGAAGQNFLLVGIGGLVLMASPAPAVVGVGQAAAAIRRRGDHLILATLGLVLSGLNVGAVVGLIAFSLAQN